MAKKQPDNQKLPPRPWMTPRELLSSFVLAGCALVMMICYWVYHGGHRGGLVEIDRAPPLNAKFLVDINRADWPEIIQLPGLGETLAQRILVERQANGPFRAVEELVRVDGIGNKTLEKIRPYLLSIPQDTDWADVNSDYGETFE